MATTLSPHAHLLSKHSSNPLQVGSSDSLNARYLAQVAPRLGGKAGRRGPTDEGEESEPEEDDATPEEDEDSPMELEVTEAEEEEKPSGTVDGIEEDLVVAPQSDPVWDSAESSQEKRLWDEAEEAEGEDEDDDTLALKPPNERAEILGEIQDLLQSVEGLGEGYRLIDRLGEGTFSSVYKAEDLKYDEHVNTYWLGRHPPHSSAYYQTIPPQRNGHGKAYVAIKRIYVTSSPTRIENEVNLMEGLRGCRHVAQLMTAFRDKDQVVAIMPFHRNQDFRAFYRVLPLPQMQNYFRCLFRALKDIHARRVIHRDVKPANFLFDPLSQVGTLVDFGLAQEVYPRSEKSSTRCLHSYPTREYPHGRFSNKDTSARIDKAKAKFMEAAKRAAQGPERVGWPTQDERTGFRTNRAGTRGFRAPEVLLKCPDQTVALDVWSAGVILLSFLTGKFPVFNSNDDVEALMEIAALYGKDAMARCAYLHNRTFLTNVPSCDHEGVPLASLVKKLNPSLFSSPDTDPTLLAQALDLLPALLNLDCTHRLTSAKALQHPFLFDPSQPEHTVVPHPIGEGICGKAHWEDDMDASHCVRVDGREIHIRAGEGIPIGEMPCEIHKERGWTDEGPGSDHGVYDM